MDKIESLARELGKAIQKDERYLNFEKAIEYRELINSVKQIAMNFGREMQKGDEADQEKLDSMENEFTKAIEIVRNHPKMIQYEEARNGLDSLMKFVTGILSMCACGEDPDTCDPNAQDSSCAGDCSSS